MSRIEGFDELQGKLDGFAKKAEELDQQGGVSVSELLTDSFISQNTSFASAEEMFKASGFKVETQENFAAIPDADWDSYIRSVSSFDDWKSMLGAAAPEWVRRKLGL